MKPDQTKGFFVGWLNHPDPETHLKILRQSYAVWLAFDGSKGFINAIYDGVFYSFVPLLEVLPEYRGYGIGKELLRRMNESLENMYVIDIVCDESVSPFSEAEGFARCVEMVKRNYEKQS